MNEECIIKIKRRPHLVSCTADFVVFIDGQKREVLTNDSKPKSISLSPGSHSIYINAVPTLSLNIFPINSNSLQIELVGGQTVTLESGVLMRYCVAFVIYFFVIAFLYATLYDSIKNFHYEAILLLSIFVPVIILRAKRGSLIYLKSLKDG